MPKVRLECIYEVYDRYCPAETRRVAISGQTMRACLLKLLDVVSIYANSDDILEIEEEKGRKLTVDEIIDKIDGDNGDGCDFIISITDTISGKALLTCNDCCTVDEYTSDEYEDVEVV